MCYALNPAVYAFGPFLYPLPTTWSRSPYFSTSAMRMAQDVYKSIHCEYRRWGNSYQAVVSGPTCASFERH
jgi:hypothetical protein